MTEWDDVFADTSSRVHPRTSQPRMPMMRSRTFDAATAKEEAARSRADLLTPRNFDEDDSDIEEHPRMRPHVLRGGALAQYSPARAGDSTEQGGSHAESLKWARPAEVQQSVLRDPFDAATAKEEAARSRADLLTPQSFDEDDSDIDEPPRMRSHVVGRGGALGEVRTGRMHAETAVAGEYSHACAGRCWCWCWCCLCWCWHS